VLTLPDSLCVGCFSQLKKVKTLEFYSLGDCESGHLSFKSAIQVKRKCKFDDI